MQTLSTCIPLESLLNILSKRNVPAKATFSLTVFEILLSEGRSVLSPDQREQGAKGLFVKNQKNIGNLLKLLEKQFTYNVRRFLMLFKFV